MKKILVLFLLIPLSLWARRQVAASFPNETLERLRGIYPNQSEDFILKRIALADSAFQKWRSFPPYYYDLLGRMNLSVMKERLGLCAGDAHIENFGYLYLSDSKFLLNDLDDVASCSLNADAMRLFIGMRLIGSISSKDFLEAYSLGLKGEQKELPLYLEKLYKESQSKKSELHSKNIKMAENKVCEDEYKNLTNDELKMITIHLEDKKQKFVWGCSRNKMTGGSAGLLRFVVFFKGENKELAGIELKPLVTPAPWVGRKIASDERMEMFKDSVEKYMGENYLKFYYPIMMNDVVYQRKPLWKGNISVELRALSGKDLQEVMIYEANRLGLYHKNYGSNLSLDEKMWETLAQDIERLWRKEFAE